MPSSAVTLLHRTCSACSGNGSPITRIIWKKDRKKDRKKDKKKEVKRRKEETEMKGNEFYDFKSVILSYQNFVDGKGHIGMIKKEVKINVLNNW